MAITTNEELLRRLVLHDERCLESILAIRLSSTEIAGLDDKSHALARLGALVALGGSHLSYHWGAVAALNAGATADDVVGTLVAVAPVTGLARVISAIPGIALAIGYDIDQAFETFNGF